jgi:uncharacterized Zn finger protein (UPF0148 family)
MDNKSKETLDSDLTCPVCGGTLIKEDGWLICVTPGTCTYSKELE